MATRIDPPTVPGWGIALMALLFLGAGTLLLGLGRSPAG